MANCELIEKCLFFNDKMGNMPGTAEMFKKNTAKKIIRIVPGIWLLRLWEEKRFRQIYFQIR